MPYLTTIVVIQGASEMGTRLSEAELQKSLDFCVNLFNPTSPEQHQRVAEEKGKRYVDVSQPIVDPASLRDVCASTSKSGMGSPLANGQNETEMVLNKINARRVVHSEYYINNLELEPLEGMVVILERGQLGLRSATTAPSGHSALLPL